MIYIGTDHAGVALKEAVARHLSTQGIAYMDLGTHSTESVDFPEYAFAVASRVVADRQAGKDSVGVLLCGSGIGMSIAANKVSGARAALALTPYMGAQGREHDDANILVLPGRILTETEALPILDAFLTAQFDHAEAHTRRVRAIEHFEETYL